MHYEIVVVDFTNKTIHMVMSINIDSIIFIRLFRYTWYRSIAYSIVLVNRYKTVPQILYKTQNNKFI